MHSLLPTISNMHWGTRFLCGFLVSYIKLTLTQQNTRGCSVWGSLGGISADVQSCGATAISKYEAMMSWVS